MRVSVRQTNGQTHKQTGRQRNSQACRHTDGQRDTVKKALPTCRYQKRKVKMRPMPKPMNQATKRTDRYW